MCRFTLCLLVAMLLPAAPGSPARHRPQSVPLTPVMAAPCDWEDGTAGLVVHYRVDRSWNALYLAVTEEAPLRDSWDVRHVCLLEKGRREPIQLQITHQRAGAQHTYGILFNGFREANKAGKAKEYVVEVALHVNDPHAKPRRGAKPRRWAKAAQAKAFRALRRGKGISVVKLVPR